MDVRKAILDWSTTLPGWRRDLLRRIAVQEADDQVCAEVLELLLGEHGLAPAALTAQALGLQDLPEDAPATPGVLYEIGECRNVNAIDSAEALTFESAGITLVYGANGAGKSSYTRVIKRVARAAQEEAVLPNVFSSKTGPPRAVIDLENENGRTKHIVPLAEQGLALLGSMTVFDAGCAIVYLRKEKTVAFTPTPLRIFGRAARAQRRIRELLDDRIAARRGRSPSFEAFPAGTAVRNLLDELAASTSDTDLTELAQLSTKEIERAAQAKLELATVDAGAAESHARERDRESDALEALVSLIETVERSLRPEAEQKILQAFKAVGEAEDAVATLLALTLTGEPLAQTGSEAWRRMWQAAREFVEQDCDHPFPPARPGEVCPLCQQELQEDARDRLRRFEEFVKSELEQTLAVAKEAAEAAVESISPAGLNAVRESSGLAYLKDERPDLAGSIDAWLRSAEARALALRAGKEPDSLAAPDLDAVRELAKQRREAAAHQRSLIDLGKQATLRHELAELEARIALRDRLAEIQSWHTNLKTIEALERLRKELDTGSLSHKQTELAKTLVTDELKRSVRRELDALGFAHLKVDLSCRTDKGATVARLGLDGSSAAVSDVLSDGEQRACALAFFLAEALSSNSTGGIVFDDPSSSFDVEKVDHIARRVVDLAQKRQQVIVFTHNVVFAWCLQNITEQENVPFSVRPLGRIGDKAGIVRTNQAWPGERLKTRIGRLRLTLQELEARWHRGEIDRYEVDAKVFAGDVREAWEKAVEEELLRGVVMRFQRDVNARKIRDVVVTAAMTQEVFDGMTETSPYHHEAPLGKPVATPSVEELKGYLKRLETFCAGFKQKAGEAKGAVKATPGSAA